MTILISKNTLIPWCAIDVVVSKLTLVYIFDNFQYVIPCLENECPTPHVSRQVKQRPQKNQQMNMQSSDNHNMLCRRKYLMFKKLYGILILFIQVSWCEPYFLMPPSCSQVSTCICLTLGIYYKNPKKMGFHQMLLTFINMSFNHFPIFILELLFQSLQLSNKMMK